MMFTEPTEAATRAVEAAYAQRPPPSPPPTDADWARLRATVERVHRWWPRPPVPEVALASFEARHRVRLPPEYRRFKRTIGDYGRRLSQWHAWDAALALPWAKSMKHDHWPIFRGPLRGAALGLTWQSEWGVAVLALGGPEPGTVWLALTLREHPLPTGLGFFAWYEASLAPALAEVEAADAKLQALESSLRGAAADGPTLLQLVREYTLRGDAARALDALARARAYGCELESVVVTDLVLAATTEGSDLASVARLAVLLRPEFPVPAISRPALRLRLGCRLAALERDAEAIEVLAPLLHDDSPSLRVSVALRRTLAASLLRSGRAAEALALIGPDQDRRWRDPESACECLLALARPVAARALFDAEIADDEHGYLQFKLGALALAQKQLERDVRRGIYSQQARSCYELALVQAHRGALASADESLARALESGYPIARVLADPDAAPLHATTTFQRWTAADPPAT